MLGSVAGVWLVVLAGLVAPAGWICLWHSGAALEPDRGLSGCGFAAGDKLGCITGIWLLGDSDLMVYRQFLFRKLDNPGSLCSSECVRLRFTAFALLMWLFLALPLELVSKCQHITVYLHSVLLYGYCFSCLKTSFESISCYVNGFCFPPSVWKRWKVFSWVFSAAELLEAGPWLEWAVRNSLVNCHYCN